MVCLVVQLEALTDEWARKLTGDAANECVTFAHGDTQDKKRVRKRERERERERGREGGRQKACLEQTGDTERQPTDGQSAVASQ